MAAGHQVALQHHAHQLAGASPQLLSHLACHLTLTAVVLVGIAVAAVHHHPMGQPRLGQLGGSLIHRLKVVVGSPLAPPQHQVAIGIAGGRDNRRLAVAVDAEEMVGPGRGLHRIDCRDGTAIGAVLEADRHRQPRGHLPVGLALGGAGADGGPADQVCDVLGHNRIQQLGGGR